MKVYFYFLLFIGCVVVAQSCKNKDAAAPTEEDQAEPVTEVSVTHPMYGNMNETIEINAVSSFMLRTYVKSTAIGFLQSSMVHMGQFVSKGQTLFIIKTKEAQALGNTINILDSSLHFQGLIYIKSPGNGYVTQLSYTTGSYVQDGEQLAEITDKSSFAFLLDLPYELKPYLKLNQSLQLHLPDSTTLNGYVQSALPTLDSIAQTQRIIISVNTGNTLIPENLIAKVRLLKTARQNVAYLPKAAILSNEEQTSFWIMRLLNDSMAVKVPIRKGIETSDNIEIASPSLGDSDRVIITGNYGLPDTAKITISGQ